MRFDTAKVKHQIRQRRVILFFIHRSLRGERGLKTREIVSGFFP